MEKYKNKAQYYINEMTLDEKISLLTTTQSAIPRLNLPRYQVGGEAAHGVVDRDGGITTSFPTPLGLSQTWNPELLNRVGTAIGNEARIKYLQANKSTWLTLWAPTIDMERDPRWGRNEEAYGEDPYLTGKLSVGIITGMQGEDGEWLRMAAAPKHFYGNNNEYLRESTSNSIDPRNREEYYLKAFESAFTEGKAQSMMTAYNGINGVPGMQIDEINKVVRERWEMDGFVVSDGGALTLNVEDYQYYDTYEEALADALKKGIDCFVDEKELVEEAAYKALERNLINEDDITKAVTRSLAVREKLGQFEESIPFDEVNQELLAGEEHAELVKDTTVEQTVLLKNDNILPLGENESVFLTGPLSDIFLKDWYGGNPPSTSTIRDGFEKSLCEIDFIYAETTMEGYFEVNNSFIGIKEEALCLVSTVEKASTFIVEDWGNESNLIKDKKTNRYIAYDEITNSYKLHKSEVYDWFVKENILTDDYKYWKTWDGHSIGITSADKIGKVDYKTTMVFVQTDDSIDTAIKYALNSDITVVAVGNHPMMNGKETMDRPSMNLPEVQLRLIKELYKYNKKLIVIVVGSYPFEMNWLEENVPAIIFTTHGSQELGNATVDVLYNRQSPSGKLSQTWFKNTIQSLPPITDYDIIQGKRTYRYTDSDILYPFGHGLTYGKIDILSAEMKQRFWKKDDKVHLSIKLENTSEKIVTDTVQCYVTLSPKQRIKLPNKQLISFRKITLNPKEQKTIELGLDVNELLFWDVAKNDWFFPSAQGILQIGFSSEQIEMKLPFETIGDVRLNRNFLKVIHAERFDAYQNSIITINHQKEKVVLIKTKGWICFQDVFLSHSESEIELLYSADKHGKLNVFGDQNHEKLVGCTYFSAGNNKKISLSLQVEEITDLYFVPNENIQIKTIQEIIPPGKD